MIVLWGILVFFFTFLPIVFWGYIFSYIDSTLANRRRFFFGIIAGGISTLPILLLGKYGWELKGINIFATISQFDISQTFSLLLWLSSIILLVSASGTFLWIFQKSIQEQVLTIIKNILFFFLGILFLWGIFCLLVGFFSVFPSGNFSLSDGVSLGDFVFNSLKLVIFYYLVIGFIEEASKHFHFLAGTLPKLGDTKEIVLLSVFVALGFAFVENIIYFWNILLSEWLWGEFIKSYIFRSCFSLMVHVICSALLAHTFSIVWYKKNLFSLSAGIIFIGGILTSLLLHAIYDISLTLGFWIISLVYFLGGYLYVSGIFYRDTLKGESDTSAQSL